VTDRLQRLRTLYPDVSVSVLMNLPAAFEGDASKVHLFAATWSTAEVLSSMLKKHVLGLGGPEATVHPDVVGPTFRELADLHSGGFLDDVRRMARRPGGVDNAAVVEAFMQRVEKVKTLQEDVRAATLEQSPSRARSR
jgi:hypothetical protein